MDLNHGRLDAPVAHVGLDVGQGHDLDPQGAERMEKVVDSHVRQSSSSKCLVEAAAKSAFFDVGSSRRNEDQIVATGPVLPATQSFQCRSRLV